MHGSAARGAALVIVALVIGFLLLRDDDVGDSQLAVGTQDPDTEQATDEGGRDQSPTTDPTTTADVTRPPSEVKALVANGSGVNGAAGAATDALESLGYVTGTPTDAAERVPETVVYFVDGYQKEAEALAEAIGASASSVAPIPPVAPVADLQLANVLVVLGPDLATG